MQGAYAGNGLMGYQLNTGNHLPLLQPYNIPVWNYDGDEVLLTIPPTMVDWILVELRISPDTCIARKACILLSDGTITDVYGNATIQFNIPQGQYYVCIGHRSHLSAMSASRIPLPTSDILDFTDTTGFPTYGKCEISLASGVMGLIAGDINYDKIIKYSGANNDRSLILQKIINAGGNAAINATVSGYHKEDLRMDGIVKYSGAGNDPSMIIQNIVSLTGNNAINSTFTGPVPHAVFNPWPCYPQPEQANAGPDDLNIPGTSVNLQANQPMNGIGAWTVLSGIGASFVDASLPNTSFSGDVGVIYTLVWTISTDCGITHDTVLISFSCYPTPDLANAGPDSLDIPGTSITLQANQPVNGTGVWIILSGTGGGFADSSLYNTMFSGQSGNAYTLVWTIGNHCGNSNDTLYISFACTPQPDHANAGPDSLNIPGTSVTLQANQPVNGTGLWTILSGTGGSFSDSLLHNTLFTGQVGNGYSLIWTISNACGSSSDTVLIGFAASQVFNCGTNLTDTRDGQQYPTVQIGTQCWMAKNLNIGTMVSGSSNQTNNSTIEKYCYSNDANNCAIYGGLYQWNEMMGYTTTPGTQGICPTGWHIPTDEEWCNLTTFLDATVNCNTWGWSGTSAGGNMKTADTAHWYTPNYGATDSSEFNALGAGYRNIQAAFDNLKYGAYFWSSSGYSSKGFGRYVIFNFLSVNRTNNYMTLGFSVRCLKSNHPHCTPQPDYAYAGPDSLNIPGTFITLQANQQTNGTGIWSVLSGTGGSFADSSLNSSTFTGVSGNGYTLVWTISNHCGKTRDTVNISFADTSGFKCGSIVTDTRDGQQYPTVQITSQCWMAKNLNVGTMVSGSSNQTNNSTIEKYCYNNDANNCAIYGGLYQWNEMMGYVTTSGVQGICPAGWHIPTGAEWCILTTFLDPTMNCNATAWSGTDAGGKMKEAGTNYWNSPNTGATNSSGFTALGAGFRYSNGSFSNLTGTTYFWSSSGYSSTSDFGWGLRYNDADVSRNSGANTYGFSVRCIRNSIPPCTPQPTQANAGPDSLNIIGTSLTLQANQPTNGTGVWSIHSGTNGSFADSSVHNTLFTGQVGSAYTLVWTISNQCGSTHDSVNISFAGINAFNCGDTLTDTRDDQQYPTVQIGTQCWMAKNLNIGVMVNSINTGSSHSDVSNNGIIEKYCYANDPANCAIYGGLYDWNEMMEYEAMEGAKGICPVGWHLPSHKEWIMLEGYADDVYGQFDGVWNETGNRGYNAGINLKSTNGWVIGSGNNKYGFSGLPGGIRHDGGSFDFGESNGYFWTSTEIDSMSARWRGLVNYFDGVRNFYYYKNSGRSIRCVLDCSTQQPDQANAGQDNYNLAGVSYQLQANIPSVGNGVWRILVGEGCSFADSSHANTVFSIQTPGYYVLSWSIYNECSFSTDTVILSFPFPGCDNILDARDNQQYPTVQIGTQCWMARNLNIGVMVNNVYTGINHSLASNNGIIEKYCYNNAPALCAIFGGLYDWNEMMNYTTTPGAQGVCPAGWHIPTDAEWCTLTSFLDPMVDCNSWGWSGINAGGKMKAKGYEYWYAPNTGATNSSGFTALGAGYRWYDGGLSQPMDETYFWSSSEYEPTNSIAWILAFSMANVGRSTGNQSYGYSVRCLRDSLPPCTPQPDQANAGPDVFNISGFTYQLQANQPVNGAGLWTILSGTNGSFADSSVHNTLFTGQVGSSYTIEWTISNTCGSKRDTVKISFADTSAFTCGATLTDTRDGQQYSTVQIGTQCWMAKNLNTGMTVNGSDNQLNNGQIEKYCYANQPSNCETFGGLYQWNEAMHYSNQSQSQGICPVGWHIPNMADWCTLSKHIDPAFNCNIYHTFIGATVGGSLKAPGSTFWDTPNSGATNSSGFTAIGAGHRSSGGGFEYLRSACFMWSSDFDVINSSFKHVYLSTYSAGLQNTTSGMNGFSVRCLRDLNIPCSPQPDTAIAGSDTFNIQDNWIQLQANSPVNGTGLWRILSGQGGSFGNDTLHNTTFFGSMGMCYRLAWTITNECGANHDTISICFADTGNFSCGKYIVDRRDWQTYPTLQIGTQCWMQKNLNTGTMISGDLNPQNDPIIEKYCFNNNPANCSEYGGLYQWDEMMMYSTVSGSRGICPEGWHIPSDSEWCTLTQYVDSTVNCQIGGHSGVNAGGQLKEQGTTHWSSPNTGATNQSGFTALAGGTRNLNATFSNFLYAGMFWTSTIYQPSYSLTRQLLSTFATIGRYSEPNNRGFSVRCIWDSLPCYPLPDQANAGQDQMVALTDSVVLNPAIPANGNGYWRIVEGLNGHISDSSQPNAILHGLPGSQYRLVWTVSNLCGSNSDTVCINFILPLSGTYSIGNDSSDYLTLQEAITDMTLRGISGPVVFNMDSSSGPYTGGLELSAIPGSSSLSTITVNGNGSVLNEGQANYILALNGVSYITLNKIRMINTNPSINKFGIMVRGGSHHVSLSNSFINMGTTSTSSTHACIVVSNSTSSATSSGNNAQYLTITGNELIGGYYGITLLGSSPYLNCFGHVIANNVIRDFHLYGIYLNNCDSNIIESNDIYRNGRSSYSTFYGIYLSSCRYTRVMQNKIHSTGTGSYSAYPIYLTTSVNDQGYETDIINNAIFNIQSTGTIYGLYFLGTGNTNIRILHNTLHLVSSGSGNVRGINFSTTPNFHILKNNIISVRGNGTGTKYCIYANPSNSFVSDHNVLHMGATSGTNHCGYWGAAQTTFQDWKVSSGQDMHSLSTNPDFFSTDSIQTVSVPIWRAGTYLDFVPNDIFGTVRDTLAPCMGAYEYVPLSRDAAVTSLIAPTMLTCTGQNEVRVKVRNMGIQPFTGVSIGWNVNGVQKPSVYYPGTLSPGQEVEVIMDTIDLEPLTPYQFSLFSISPDGLTDMYNRNDTLKSDTIYTSLKGTLTIGDSTSHFPGISQAITAMQQYGICGPVILDFKENTGPYFGSFEMQSFPGASDNNTITLNGNGNILQDNGSSYIIAFNGSSFITLKNFRIINSNPSNNRLGIVIRGGSHHLSISNNIIEMGNISTNQDQAGIVLSSSLSSALSTGNNGQYNTISDNQIKGGYYGIVLNGSSEYAGCYGNNITNNTLEDFYRTGIYVNNADTTIITGNNISRKTRTTLTTFSGIYVSYARNIKIHKNQIHSSGSGTYNAYGIYVNYSQNLPGAETEIVNNAVFNIPSTSSADGIYFTGNINYLRIIHNTIHLISYANATVRGIFFGAAPNNVVHQNNIISIRGTGTGTKYLVYVNSTSTNFNSNYNALHISAGGTSNYLGYWIGARNTITDWQNSSAQDANSIIDNPNFFAIDDFRTVSIPLWRAGTSIPEISEDICGNSRDSLAPCIGAYEYTPPTHDAGITSMITPNIPVCPGSNSVRVVIKNMGIQLFTGAIIKWSVNGVHQTPFTYSGSLAPAEEDTIIVGTYNFYTDTSYSLVFYPEFPGGQPDQYSLNDTLYINNIKTALVGEYMVGDTGLTHYTTIQQAFSDMSLRGLCGPVTLNCLPGQPAISGGFEITNYPGVSSTNTISIQGNGNTIRETSSTFIIGFNAASNVSLKNFNITNTNPSSNKIGILIRNGSQHIDIIDCRIDMGLLSTNNSACIAITNSLTSPVTAGNNGQYISIINNELTGGVYGISLLGLSSSNRSLGNSIKNNILKDSHSYGIYLAYNDSTTIDKNSISRPNRTNPGTFYGIYLETSRNIKVIKNHIHSTGTGSYSCYPVYLTTSANLPGYETEFINNVISNINTSGIIYGFQFTGTGNSNINLYYNTIHIISSGSGGIRGLNFATSPAYHTIKNNIISITGTGTGAKHGIYATTSPTFNSDNNIIYLNASGTNYCGYWNGNRLSLQNWINATSQDFNSHEINPQFFGENDIRSISIPMWQKGAPIPGIIDDIFGTLRDSLTPCPGAYEYNPPTNDATVTAMTAPVVPICPGINDVKIVIRNKGLQAFIGGTIKWTINGIEQQPYSFNDSVSPANEIELTIGSLNMIPDSIIDLSFYSHFPGGSQDQYPADDTLHVKNVRAGLIGSYTIGNHDSCDFLDLSSALANLYNYGVCDHVSMDVINDGAPITGGLEILNIPGTSESSRVTFNGNDNTIKETTATYIISFNSASHLSLENFRIINTNINASKIGVLIRGGSKYINIANNYIDVGITSTSTSSIGIALSASTTAISVGNNGQYVSINNNEVIGGYYGIAMLGQNSFLNCYGNQIISNQIRDFYQYGIYLANVDTTLVESNDITRSTRSTLTTFYGIYANSRNTKFLKNKIHSSGVGNYSAYPININSSVNSMGFETELVNNAIYDIPTTGQIYAIYIQSSSTKFINIYHNSVHLIATGTNSARGIFSESAVNYNLANNIISIQGPGTGTKYCIYFSANSTTLTSNYNDFYINSSGGTNHLGYWSSNRTSLLNWQTGTSQDANSISTNPAFFTSSTYKTNAPGLYRTGLSLNSITTDIDGNSRNITAPCIGAYEFELFNRDAGITSFIIGNQICTGSNIIQVRLRNWGLMPFTGARIHWSVNGIAKTPVIYPHILAPDTDALVMLDSFNMASLTQYNFTFHTDNPDGVPDLNPSNDTLHVDSIYTPLNGTYYVNPNGSSSFVSLAEAVVALIVHGICGPVTIILDSATGPYMGGIEIPAITGSSEVNSISFIGNNNILNESSVSYLLAFNGASHVNFSGFRLINSNPASAKFGIMVRGASHHLSFTQNSINVGISSTSTAQACIAVSGSTTNATTAGNNGNNIIIEGNEIIGGYYGITFNGSSGYQFCFSNIIRNNVIKDFYSYGVYLSNTDTTLITSNNISRNNRTSLTDFYGISLSTSRNSKIYKNSIHSTGTGSYAAYSLYVSTSVNTISHPTEIINNAIYNIPTTGIIYGIHLLGSGNTYINIFFNTIHIEKSGTGSVRGLYFATTPNNHVVKNNIISIRGTGTGTKHCVYSTTSTSFISDYNLLHIEAGGSANYTGYWTSNRATLTDWKTASGNDNNSLDVNPQFFGTQDFRTNSSTIYQAGYPINTVLDDIFGTIRDVSTPCIGAYEFVPD
ncbi:MAG: right-handed parallel beta-helix repeat-containing protein [Lentimicrobiaceae bacterium]|nr:right-handed parallel beta-helix repeat-containing protein [Lentimicrobiaceae bacterium]